MFSLEKHCGRNAKCMHRFSKPPTEFFQRCLGTCKYAIAYSLRRVCAGFILWCCLDQSENIVDKMRCGSLNKYENNIIVALNRVMGSLTFHTLSIYTHKKMVLIRLFWRYVKKCLHFWSSGSIWPHIEMNGKCEKKKTKYIFFMCKKNKTKTKKIRHKSENFCTEMKA